jgi:PiT family inorganic phosphate transporter
MIFSDFLVCLSHGSNDCSNAISPLIVLMVDIDKYPVWSCYLVGAGGIALGLLIAGERVMKTIGGDIIALDYMKGFSSQFATAICVSLGSSLGVSLSTTHCIVGALAGVHISGKSSHVKHAYYKE